MIIFMLAFSTTTVTSTEKMETPIQTVFENMDIFDVYFDFYQVNEVIFINNNLRNVTISVNSVANVTIIGNTFTEQQDIAILVWDSSNVTIKMNKFVNQPAAAISLHKTTAANILNNTIELGEDAYNQWYLLVGINIDRSPQTIAKFNDIYSPIGDGVYIHTSPDTLFMFNNIHHTGFIGLSLISSDNSKILNNSITDSSSYQLKNSGDIPPSSAVGISDSNAVKIKYNLINYSDNSGIDVVSSDDLIIEYNTIINHEVSGIFLGLSENCVIRYNTFYNNAINVETDQSDNLINEDNTNLSDSPIEDTVSRTKNESITEETPFYLNIMFLMVYIVFRKYLN